MKRKPGVFALVMACLVLGMSLVGAVAADVTGTSFVNGNFDSGPGAGWTEYSALQWPVITNGLYGDVTPRSKFYVAWLGGYDREAASVTQVVTISDAAPLLDYWTWIESTESNCKWDVGYLYVAGRALSTTGLCEANKTGGWSRRMVDLSPFIGRTVPVRFEVTTDASYISSQYIDDVALISNPLPPLEVTATKNGALVRLAWQHNPAYTSYEVWRSLDPYFLTGEAGSEKRGNVAPPPLASTAVFDDSGATGDDAANYYYLVRGVGADAVRTSSRTGEFDFRLVPGSAG